MAVIVQFNGNTATNDNKILSAFSCLCWPKTRILSGHYNWWGIRANTIPSHSRLNCWINISVSVPCFWSGISILVSVGKHAHIIKNNKHKLLWMGRGDRKSTRLNSSHVKRSRMPSSAWKKKKTEKPVNFTEHIYILLHSQWNET